MSMQRSRNMQDTVVTGRVRPSQTLPHLDLGLAGERPSLNFATVAYRTPPSRRGIQLTPVPPETRAQERP